MIPPDLFKEAMGRLAGSVTVITTGQGAARTGLTATSVTSLSGTPPSLLACVNRSASAHDTLLAEGCFGVALLRPAQSEIAERFAGAGGATGEQRYHGLAFRTAETGAPLLEEAAVSFDCSLHAVHDGFSHSILVGVIRAVILGPDDGVLLWRRRRFCFAADLD